MPFSIKNSTTLNVKSYYDKKELSSENYYYTHNDEKIYAYFNRTNTPLIG